MTSSDVSQGVAIIGLAGRFPGARDVAVFWENLCAGRECLSTFSDEQLLAAGVTPAEFSDPAYVRRRAVLDDAECFDAPFFGITHREAELMDPQHRVFLECCWHAFEDAGQDPKRCPNVGVFASSSLNTYVLRQVLGGQDGIGSFTKQFQTEGYNVLLGADKDYLATRVAFKLNLRGPALTIQTACSSSLVAVAQACASLQTFQCDAALAGGVSVSFPQERGYFYQEGAIASADGSCRAFDAAAQGTVFGAGCGVVLLKRYEDARRDGNPVYAVIRSAALNNDGSGKMSFGAPSQDGQAEVIELAHALAGISADTISYVEAHGTGTPLGDPIEVAALTQAFRATSSRRKFCGLGSVKTNIGHLESAAGVTSLIKVALALRHRFLPATLHFKNPNPSIDFAGSPFEVVAAARAWTDVPLPRRAGVSSFGVGGTNAHLVVEEAPETEPAGEARPIQLLVLSAKSPAALDELRGNLARWLAGSSAVGSASGEPSLADVAFTLQCGREAFAHRHAVVVRDAADAVRKLQEPSARSAAGITAAEEPQVVFLFPGQGSQYAGMGRELYQSEAVFRAAIDRCAAIIRDRLGFDLVARLFAGPESSQAQDSTSAFDDTRFTQPAIFAVEYALAILWQSWGIKPTVVIGHSIGEYVCAVLAGTFTLEDALALLAQRAELMRSLPSGSMLAVRLSGADAAPLLPPDTCVAAYNSDRLCTISGPAGSLQQLQARLEARRIACRPLATSHAFHSAAMDPIVQDFAAAATAVRRESPKLRWVSTCTGNWITAEEATDPAYWARQLRQPVRFADAFDKIAGDPGIAILEVGPGQALTQLARQHPRRPESQIVASSLQASGTGGELSSMLDALGRLWVGGVQPDWVAFNGPSRRHRVSLPGYPFARIRHWAEPRPSAATQEEARDSLAAAIGTGDAEPVGIGHDGAEIGRLEELIHAQLSAMRKQLLTLAGR